MTDDLVKRLRNEKMGCNLWCEYYDGITTIPLCIEAADRIEMLEVALLEIFDHECRTSDKSFIACVARDALWHQALEGKDD